LFQHNFWNHRCLFSKTNFGLHFYEYKAGAYIIELYTKVQSWLK
jgi:hypothetical protein